jgi:hypothetical protein
MDGVTVTVWKADSKQQCNNQPTNGGAAAAAVVVAAALQRYVGCSLAAARRLRQRGGGARGSGGNDWSGGNRGSGGTDDSSLNSVLCTYILLFFSNNFISYVASYLGPIQTGFTRGFRKSYGGTGIVIPVKKCHRNGKHRNLEDSCRNYQPRYISQ